MTKPNNLYNITIENLQPMLKWQKNINFAAVFSAEKTDK